MCSSRALSRCSRVPQHSGILGDIAGLSCIIRHRMISRVVHDIVSDHQSLKNSLVSRFTPPLTPRSLTCAEGSSVKEEDAMSWISDDFHLLQFSSPNPKDSRYLTPVSRDHFIEEGHPPGEAETSLSSLLRDASIPTAVVTSVQSVYKAQKCRRRHQYPIRAWPRLCLRI